MKVYPGKLNQTQRDMIVGASAFLGAEPIPFSVTNIPYLGRSSMAGLLKRGLMEERNRFYYLTRSGYMVARQIFELIDEKRHRVEIAAISAYLEKMK